MKRRLAMWVLLLVVVGMVVGCGSKSEGNEDVASRGDSVVSGDIVEMMPEVRFDLLVDVALETTPVDAVPETTPSPEVVDLLDSGPCGPTCPEGYCDDDLGVCLACDEEIGCAIPNHWCKDGMCVETLCVPESKTCDGDETAKSCAEDGESWLEETCEEGFICAAGSCQEVICAPGDSTCNKGLLTKCDPKGVAWLDIPCPPGQGCFKDECEKIRHNLLLIFDTSGSMASIGFMDQVPCICGNQSACQAQPFPQCEDPDCPVSKLGLSKHVFNQFFEVENINNVHLVLTHFPQRIKNPPVTSCNNIMSFGRGWYGFGMADSDKMTGDDGSHVTEDGGWFDQYLYEILSVPFPTSWEEENLDDLALWVNFDEAVGSTETPCTSKADCPGGFCSAHEETGEMVCWYHTDPELRALTGTPLGPAMFYAGEVYRKQIQPNGKTCTEDADCKNRNYYCSKSGVCKDPFAHCRANMILMFTDGVESPETSLSEFFNPRVQAKRFRYGLGCNSDEDCFDGSTCVGNRCDGYPHPYSGGGAIPPNTGEPWRLLDYNGNAIQVTTHVIDLSSGEGEGANRSLADDGGGTYYHADDLDPNELLEQMMTLLDPKQNLLDCVPNYEDEE